MIELTEKQSKTLQFILSETKKNGYQPSVREMALHFGITARALHHHLQLMEKKGRLRLTGKARAIEIINRGSTGK